MDAFLHRRRGPVKGGGALLGRSWHLRAAPSPPPPPPASTRESASPAVPRCPPRCFFFASRLPLRLLAGQCERGQGAGGQGGARGLSFRRRGHCEPRAGGGPPPPPPPGCRPSACVRATRSQSLSPPPPRPDRPSQTGLRSNPISHHHLIIIIVSPAGRSCARPRGPPPPPCR